MAVKDKGKSKAKSKTKNRGTGGRLLPGHNVTAAAKQKKIEDKAKFAESISLIIGMPSDDPVTQLLAGLAVDSDVKNRLKMGELLVRKISPQEEKPGAIAPDVLELLSALQDFRRLGGMERMKEICGGCEKFKDLWSYENGTDDRAGTAQKTSE